MEVRSSYTYWCESFCWYCLSFFDRVDKYIRVTNFKVQDYNFETGVVIPSDDKHKTNNITLMAMDFEAKHRECVRVLTYTDDGHVKVKLFVLSGKSGIPETLKAAAQYIFKEMDVKLEWLDLYRM